MANIASFIRPGDTDATAGFLRARDKLDLTDDSETLSIPPGTYNVRGSGPELFLLTKAIHVVGSGMSRSRLIIHPSVGAGTDIFRYRPSNVRESTGFQMRDFSILAASGRPARNALTLDVTRGFMRRVLIENMYMDPLGGRSIDLHNPDRLHTLFCSTIRECQLFSGIRLIGAADSIHIHDCALSGPNIGMEIEQISGAANLTIGPNVNCTATLGALLLKGAHHPVICNNYFEPVTAFGWTGIPGSGAMVEITGRIGSPIWMPTLIYNQISLLPGFTADAVLYGRVSNPVHEHNSLSLAEAGSRGFRPTAGQTVGYVASATNKKSSGTGTVEI